MRKLGLALIFLLLSISSLASYAGTDSENICAVLKKHPNWLQATEATAKKWGIPSAVQLAIIRQESNFKANAKNSKSSATGYAQVINKSWAAYEKATKQSGSRNSFTDASNYIGWYSQQVEKRAHVEPDNAYKLYLAYHEGIGGYHHLKTHPNPKVANLAHSVASNAQRYTQQLASCGANQV